MTFLFSVCQAIKNMFVAFCAIVINLVIQIPFMKTVILFLRSRFQPFVPLEQQPLSGKISNGSYVFEFKTECLSYSQPITIQIEN